MSVSPLHARHHGPVVAAMARTMIWSLAPRRSNPSLPPPDVVRCDVPSLPPSLLRDYVRHVGGDPSVYRDQIPPHLFSAWGVGLGAKLLRGLPYPFVKIVNAGCRLEVNAPLPTHERLHATARLESSDDDGRRIRLHQRITTGTQTNPEAVVAHVFAIVPKPKADERQERSTPKQRPRVPDQADEIARFRLSSRAGLDFAILTGDFNPIHWVPSYARSFGFPRPILHGFSTFARTYEGLQRAVFSGSTRALIELDVKFTRPLVLPARVGLFVLGREVFVGDARGGPCYLSGTFEGRGAATSEATGPA